MCEVLPLDLHPSFPNSFPSFRSSSSARNARKSSISSKLNSNSISKIQARALHRLCVPDSSDSLSSIAVRCASKKQNSDSLLRPHEMNLSSSIQKQSCSCRYPRGTECTSLPTHPPSCSDTKDTSNSADGLECSVKNLNKRSSSIRCDKISVSIEKSAAATSSRGHRGIWVPRCSSRMQILFLFLPALLLILLPDFGEASICIDNYKCETGEEKRVVKCVDEAIDLVPMCLSPALLQLSLHSTKIHALYLVSLRFYTDLRHVNLSDNKINYIEAKSFECQPSLEELHLDHNKLTNLDPDTFLGLHNLTVLSLQGNLLDEIPDRTFQHLRRLEMLDLSHNRIHSIGDQAFQPLSLLRVLKLRNNMLTVIPALPLSHVPNLAELSLGTNSFTSLRAEDLAPLTFLTSLDLSGAPLEEGLHAESFAALRDLRLLRLDDCGLKEVPTEALSVLERLENLYLNRNQFVELGPEILDKNKRLQIIEITGCPELERLSSDVFKSNLDLRRVIIARNPKLWIIPAGTFRFLTQMTYFDIHANNLRTLQREIAVWNDIPIWLVHDNPLECNCSVAWLREQLDINSSKPAVLCSTPQRLAGRALATTEVADVSCGMGPATQGLIIGVLVVVLLALLIGVVLILMFRHRRPFFRELFKRPEWNGRNEWNGRCSGSTCSRDLRAYPHDYPEYIMASHKPVPVTEL